MIEQLLWDLACLMVVFQTKHFLCDYPLQNEYMLGKFKPGSDWVLPLGAHALVHALVTLSIGLVYLGWFTKWVLVAMIFDFVVF